MSATAEIVKKAIKGTWFDVEDDGGTIILSSREYGDVGDESAGAEDIKEARRLIVLLRNEFPTVKVEGDIVDEWVMVTLHP